MAPVRPLAKADPSAPSYDEALSVFTPIGGGLGDVGNDHRKHPVLEVAEIWGDTVLDVRHFAPDHGPVSVGDGGDLSHGADEACELLRWSGHEVLLTIDGSWTGWIADARGHRLLAEVIAAGDARPTEDGRWEIVLPALAIALVETGTVSFMAREVPAGLRFAGRSGRPDYPFMGVMALFGAVALALSAVIATAPPPTEEAVIEIPDRFAEVMLAVPTPEIVQKIKERVATNKGKGEKAAREEGKVGRRESRMERAKGSKVELNKQRMDKEIAENSGLLGAVSDRDDLAGLFGSGLDASLTEGIGGLFGAKGVQVGSGGLSSRGGGLGGGGRAHGIGGTGTRGRNTGDGTYGETGGFMGPKVEGQVRSDEMIKVGAMDKSLIDGVVKRHMNAIRYCYQRELTQDPNLAGKVTVRFVIAADGSVSSARIKTSSLGNAATESCMTDRFLRMQFPQVQGGGIVIVSYPFMFSAG